jgi:hypothetical protein
MGSLFEKLFNFLVDLLTWISNVFLNLIIDFLNATIQIIADCYSFVVNLLPSSSGLSLNIPSSITSHIGSVNWFIPVGTIVDCVSFFCVAMIAYMTVKPVLKFLHVT